MKKSQKILGLALLITIAAWSGLQALSVDTLAVSVVNTDRTVGSIKFVRNDSTTLILRVLDEQGVPIAKLTRDQVTISRESKKAKIDKVEPLQSVIGANLNIVLVLDNSSSMSPHINELFASVEKLLQALGGKSRVAVVVFSEQKSAGGTVNFMEKPVNLRFLDFTADMDAVRKFVKRAYSGVNLSRRTYLHDAILYGLQTAKELPETAPTAMVIFSDGKDLGSRFREAQVIGGAAGVKFTIYSIDFSKARNFNPLLKRIAQASPQGKAFQASKAEELLPIFEKLSKEIITEFKVTYHFPIPPSGDIQFTADQLVVKTRKVIDEFPMLNYVFFDSNAVNFSDKYILFSSPEEAARFKEDAIQKPLQKYYHVLNVIGSRLQKDEKTSVTLIGCNMNLGAEKLNKKLSRGRAQAVADYLKNIWSISADRIKILTRNLPKKPSSTKTPEGCAENRRVEIVSNHRNILMPIRSEIQEISFSPEIGYFNTKVSAPEGLEFFEVSAYAGQSLLMNKKFVEPRAQVSWNWLNQKGEKLFNVPEVTYGMKIKDKDGRVFESTTKTIPVKQIEEATTLVETKEDTIYQKFSLVLFPFNSSKLSKNNADLLKKIVDVYKNHPDCCVKVFGYCDDIGNEEYNLKLSVKRAKMACDLLRKMGISGKKIVHRGYGEINPIFSNASPEGRFLNRTVQIYVGYPAGAE
ncbi:MAG: OmpA family protein [Calditrichaeota bacterium]|nr:OmpA family protein [Calditrichota bacterium]